MSAKDKEYDLYEFVSGPALRAGKTITLTCNCGNKIPLKRPRSDNLVCTKCKNSIKLLILAKDTGFVLGQDAAGEPTLIPIAGSELKITEEEKARALSDARSRMGKKAH